MTHPSSAVEGGSFRDPCGFLFWRDGELLRQVNEQYREDYDQLMSSGLYTDLVEKQLLIPHEEVDDAPLNAPAYRVLKPERLSLVSYPYEWCFSQLRHAALATLRVQTMALARGMSLKDASAYNIQFHRGRPVFIDTLSFERYQEGKPWVAYRQFCQHFLAPLALMAYRDVRLLQMLRVHIDGVPLDLASQLLPARTKVRPGLLMHIHGHAAGQKKYAKKTENQREAKVSRRAFEGIIDSLRGAVKALKWEPAGTEWADYYNDTNYSGDAGDHKAELVKAFLQKTSPQSVWDLGANDGRYSRLAAVANAFTVAADIDPSAVEINYRNARRAKETSVHPLLMDLTNPSPAQGFAHTERMSLAQRGPADVVMALALIHHLAISNNVPLDRLSKQFAQLGRHLIIEWVPKEDSQVQRLLATREDVFPGYVQDEFEAAFAEDFETLAREDVRETKRVMYLLRRKN